MVSLLRADTLSKSPSSPSGTGTSPASRVPPATLRLRSSLSELAALGGVGPLAPSPGVARSYRAPRRHGRP